MTLCTGRTGDRYGTVWDCELDAEHAGLCRNGTLLWEGPGLERGDAENRQPEYELRTHPVEFYRWDGRAVGDGLPLWLLGYHPRITGDFETLTIDAHPPQEDRDRVMHVMEREWVLLYNDGSIEKLPADQFERLYEKVR